MDEAHGGLIRRIFGLSIGTTAARGLAMTSQLLLAVWLTPAEFGHWAAAASGIALLSGLTNLGEHSGYLSGTGSSWRSSRIRALGANSGLALLGLGVAGLYLLGGRPEVAALVAVASLCIPVAGDNEMQYSAGVKLKATRHLVTAQVCASAVKLIVAVAIAVSTGSAMALAISMIVSFLALDVLLLPLARRVNELEKTRQPVFMRASHRVAWAANALAMSLPLQASFLSAQFVSTSELLGIFYFAFQISLGVSGLMAVPLSRVSLASFSESRGRERDALASRLIQQFGMIAACASSALAILLLLAAPSVSESWKLAIPATIALLASLPIRLIGPIVDGYQQSSNAWWQSTGFNVVAALGMASAGLVGALGEVILVALSVSVWLVLHGLIRIVMVLRCLGTRILSRVLIPNLACSALILAASVQTPIWAITLCTTSMLIAIALALSSNGHRRVR
jgi:O-antigen/teichoic acid export membrane protein